MAWVLTATGDCPPEQEAELAAELTSVLSDPKYGTTASQMGAATVNGPVHQTAVPEDPPA